MPIRATQLDAMLARYGEPMVLRRKAVTGGLQTGTTDVAIIGKVNEFGHRGFHDLVPGGPMVQVEREVRIGTAAIAAAGWPAPPRKDDQVQIGGAWVTVQSVVALRSTTETIGYVLMVRG